MYPEGIGLSNQINIVVYNILFRDTMNTVAQLNEAHRDIDSHSAYSEAQEDFSNRNQYIENISNLEEYADFV